MNFNKGQNQHHLEFYFLEILKEIQLYIMDLYGALLAYILNLKKTISQ